MAEWINFDPSKLYPSELASVGESAVTLGDTLASILETAATVIDTVKYFVSGYTDAQAAAIEAFQTLVIDTVQQLTQTGVYWLKHIPASMKLDTTVFSWVNAVARSLDDVYDEDRPILVDPGAYIGCITILGTSESFKSLWQRFMAMIQLFGGIVPSIDQVNKWPEIGETFTPVPGVGQAPDWNTKRIADFIPGIGKLVDTLVDFANSVTGAASAIDLYGRFADQLNAKAALLRQIGSTIQGILNDLSAALNFDGAYLLPIYGQGDKEWLKTQLRTARGGPYNLENADYSMGMVFLATGGTTGPADVLFSLFGISP